MGFEDSAVPETAWYRLSPEAALAGLRTSRSGLAPCEAAARRIAHGPNVIVEGRRRSPFAMFIGQFTDFMTLVLVAAAAISGAIGDATDTVVILAIVVLNAVVGFIQEYRAERAMAALAAMAAPTATVLRDGAACTIPGAEVVPGDVVLLAAGGVVPADLRLLDSASLRIDEAALTGESIPVEKQVPAVADLDVSLGDRKNVAFKGTTVSYGRGAGVVFATGMATEFGKIAARLAETSEGDTPLQRRLADVGRRLAVASLLVCGAVFAAGLWRGEPPLLVLLTALSLAVAAIPEALPSVVTVALALGARKMAQSRALVRKLPAVETLGSVTTVCSDKTGTLTVNRMRAECFHCDGETVTEPGVGDAWRDLVRAMALSNDASVQENGAAVGDPTEVALLLGADAAGIRKAVAERHHPRVAELPFDSDRKCMTTVHEDPCGGFISFTKGAVEVVIDRSTRVASSSGRRTPSKEELRAVGERMAEDGLRVLAVAMRRWPALPDSLAADVVERDLTLLGLVGLMDPPREEAKAAVELCKSAGIIPVMITGDHPVTAKAIARRVGILSEGDEVLSGNELARLSADELRDRVERVRVYARVAPEQKLAIVRALQARGELVAMTGDGVNDAPALKQADIGVAMGITGTDVAKEASAMILLDDDFATIVRAVREGRRIFDNIRRFIRYAVTTNSAEVWLIFLAPFFGLPIPLLPIQILWINLVSDGLPGLALAAEPAENDVMRRPPRAPRESVFAHGLGAHVIWVGILMAALCIGTEAAATSLGLPAWQTMVFAALGFAQLAHVLAIRSERESLFTQGLLSNKPLFATVLVTFALQLATIYLEPLNRLLKTSPLSPLEFAAAVAPAVVIFGAVEIEKWVIRTRLRPSAPGHRSIRPKNRFAKEDHDFFAHQRDGVLKVAIKP